MADFEVIELAQALLAARRSGETVSTALLPIPPDFGAALATQAVVFQSLEGVVRGWKAAIRPDGQVVSAPMSPFAKTSDEASIRWFTGIGLEVELAFLLNRDLGPSTNGPVSMEQVVDAVDAVHLGVEFVASRLTEGSAAPDLLFFADGLANSGYLLGPALPFGASRLGRKWNLCVKTRAETLFDSDVTHPAVDPLAPLLALANAIPGPLGGLKAGQVITTGSLCGILPIKEPDKIVIRLEQTNILNIALEAR